MPGHKSMPEILVSVILPVYNVEKYLGRCLEDILGQTLKELEVICIDDGSTDGSLKVLQDFARRDGRVQVLHQENAGAAAARNTGLTRARGEYLSFLDSDDFFEPDMLEKAYQRAKETGSEITIFRGNRYDDTLDTYIPMDYSIKKAQLPGKNPFCWRDMPDRIFTFGVGWAWDKLYRRSFVIEEGLRFQELRTSNDLYFVFASLVKAEKICTMEELLVHHRIHVKGSLSVTRQKSWRCFYEAESALKAELERMGVYPQLEKGFVNWALHFCFWNLDTIQGEAYRDVYELLCGACSEDFGFFTHERAYYAQPELYDRLARMRKCGCVEYLLEQSRASAGELRQREERIRQLERELRDVRTSFTFRAGKVLTAIPRKLNRMIRR